MRFVFGCMKILKIVLIFVRWKKVKVLGMLYSFYFCVFMMSVIYWWGLWRGRNIYRLVLLLVFMV